MPRNGSGVYTLPQAAFTPNTTISSAAVNSDFSDIAAQLTNSLAADGQTTMTGAVKAASGSAPSPSYSFGADTNTGFYSAGSDVIGVAVGGVAVGQITSAGIANTNGVPVSIPVGTVVDFAGTVAPAGWYLCYGQSVATATYPVLFAAIGYVYGGSGPNFNLPDCRGLITAGRDDMGGTPAGNLTPAFFGTGTVLGTIGGEQGHTLSTAELASHHHSGATGNENQTHTHNFTAVLTTTTQFSAGGGGVGAASPAGSVTGTENQNHTHNFTSSDTGGGGAHNNVQPTIIFNKIIFAGA